MLLGLTTSILTPSNVDKYAFPFLSLKYVLPVVGLYPTMLWMYFGCSAKFLFIFNSSIKSTTHESRELPGPCWPNKQTQLEDDRAELWPFDLNLIVHCHWIPDGHTCTPGHGWCPLTSACTAPGQCWRWWRHPGSSWSIWTSEALNWRCWDLSGSGIFTICTFCLDQKRIVPVELFEKLEIREYNHESLILGKKLISTTALFCTTKGKINCFDLPIDGNRLGVFCDIICLHNHHSQEAGKNDRGKRVLEMVKQWILLVSIINFTWSPDVRDFSGPLSQLVPELL